MRLISLVSCVIIISNPVEAADGIYPTTPGRPTRASFHSKPWNPSGHIHYDPVAPSQVSVWGQDHYLPPKANWGKALSSNPAAPKGHNQVGEAEAGGYGVTTSNFLKRPPMHLLRGYVSSNPTSWKPSGL